MSGQRVVTVQKSRGARLLGGERTVQESASTQGRPLPTTLMACWCAVAVGSSECFARTEMDRAIRKRMLFVRLPIYQRCLPGCLLIARFAPKPQKIGAVLSGTLTFVSNIGLSTLVNLAILYRPYCSTELLASSFSRISSILFESNPCIPTSVATFTFSSLSSIKNISDGRMCKALVTYKNASGSGLI